ncbi:putative deoxyribonuclease YjjV [Vibrio aerogenes CECT 7868]|uniref:Putative deoxyribonuclease YjjV n=1 Tax=Vibrio aerogenes CECT 7868 TaxID=1216006 RepID=A0A1M5WN27_9VIBR|nr:TatD family hydrolase [Vibrio aerogenes]SHH88995.1 putative deoxyribonuclease YjjV [Vibrio aerogenes CECT 7868]
MTGHEARGRLFDTHCHFDFDVFQADPEHHLQMARQCGVERLVIPSIGTQNWQQVAQLAERFSPGLYYGLGIHPYFLHADSEKTLTDLEQTLMQADKACVAVGECGLDGMIDTPAFLQERIFLAQVSLATQARLPLIVHSRKTHDRLLSLLKKARFTYGGVVHGFSGSYQQASAFIDLGFKIGIGGVITYTRANKTRQAVRQLPEASIVIETDAPDMPVCGFQGQPNHPARLVEVFKALVSLREVSAPEFSRQLWRNSCALYGLIP